MERRILTAKASDLFKIASTMVQVIEDMTDEIKDRMDDMEDAYFMELGGSVVSKVDLVALLDSVQKDVINIIEKATSPDEVNTP